MPMDKDFMLNYNFPPFSVGECGRIGSPGRREFGHGKLAWRAVLSGVVCAHFKCNTNRKRILDDEK